MTLQDLINLAKKNKLSLNTEILIASRLSDKDVDNIYVVNGKIVVENQGW